MASTLDAAAVFLPSSPADPYTNAVLVLASFVGFHLFTACVLPCYMGDGRKSLRWKNTVVSLTHSAISAIWAVSCFYRDPKMAGDMITRFIPDARFLIVFSIGYFIHDTVDMLRFDLRRKSNQLLLHHAVIFVFFGMTLYTHLFISYATVALIIEINSIFLYIRQLMHIHHGFSKDHFGYRLNSLCNFASFILIRLLTIVWMSLWLLINKDHPLISFSLYALGSVGLGIMMIINIMLLYSLLESDVLRPFRHQQTAAAAAEERKRENRVVCVVFETD